MQNSQAMGSDVASPDTSNATLLPGFFMHLDKLLAWLEDGTLRQVR